jgi:molecular chaperone GrpE (heat shock protein)
MDFKTMVRQVKSWFCVALALKIICAVISLKTSDPTWFGFWIPITIMLAYWALGSRVRAIYDIRLTVAKFADSVYYLGFLFTVGSIIICLFDIQSIGDNLTGMAMRFGAALVSTGIGMVARTLYVGFKPDQDDAVEGVEERAIIAAENLTLMFDDTYQKLTLFRDEVLGASKEAIAGVQEQMAELSKHSKGAMDAYFANATQRSNEAFDAMLKDAQSASNDLLTTINRLSAKSEETLDRMENHALKFGEKAQARMEVALFPDDLFTKKLSPAIDTLSGTTDGVNAGIAALADDVKTAARSVGTAIRGLNTKTQILEETLVAVGNIVESQQRLMDSMNDQGTRLVNGVERVQKEFLDTLDDYQRDYQGELKASRAVIEQVALRLQQLQTKIDSDDSSTVLSQEIDAALRSATKQNASAHEAFSASITNTLLPLIEVIAKSNEMHGALAQRVEDGSRTIEIAHSQLDELVGKIDHINTIELRQPAVNEPILATVSSVVTDSAAEPIADARTV